MIRKFLALTIAVFTAAPVFAESNLSIGNVELNPYYGFTTAYDDNIFRVPANENGHAVAGGGKRSSWIFRNDLGLNLKAPTGNHTWTAGYGIQTENYDKQSKANNAFNSNAHGGWKYKGSKIKAHIKDDYRNTQDPQFSPSLANDLVTRERNWTNIADLGVEYGGEEHFFFGVNYEWYVQKYLNRAGGAASLANILNRSQNTFSMKTGMYLAPKTRAYLSAKRRLVHYTEETRQDNHRDWLFDFGLEGEFTGKLKGRVETGLGVLEYDQSRNANGTSTGRDRVGQVWRLATALEWQASESCKLIWTLNRDSQESASTASRYFTSAGTGLMWIHDFNEKFKTTLDGGFSQAKHSQNFTNASGANAARRDDNYRLGLAADYKFTDWLSTGLAYNYGARFSTFSREYNYRNSVTSWNLKLDF